MSLTTKAVVKGVAQSNPQDFRWSLIEHPQSTAMVKPEDQWISFRQPVRFVLAGTFHDAIAFQITGTGTSILVNTAILANTGTERFSLDLSLGNIGSYDLFDFSAAQSFSMAAFGTHFFAVVPSVAGTEYGTFALSPFGTHLAVSVIQDAGTEAGTFAFAPFGTATLVVFTADAGTAPGTLAWTPIGTYTPVTVHAGTHVAFGTFGLSVFGDYVAS